ncbi:MAG: GAF domain-containing protein [Acidimicrobiia bacterium]
MDRIRRALRGPGEDQLDRAAAAIRSMAGHYTGVYLYQLEDGELVLRGFAGPSPHTRIPVGTGVCGRAVAERRDILVPDVGQDDRYLASNLETRAELVVLVEHDGRPVGEIDIDSDLLDPFTPQDLVRLREAARLLAPHLAHAGHAFASS